MSRRFSTSRGRYQPLTQPAPLPVIARSSEAITSSPAPAAPVVSMPPVSNESAIEESDEDMAGAPTGGSVDDAVEESVEDVVAAATAEPRTNRTVDSVADALAQSFAEVLAEVPIELLAGSSGPLTRSPAPTSGQTLQEAIASAPDIPSPLTRRAYLYDAGQTQGYEERLGLRRDLNRRGWISQEVFERVMKTIGQVTRQDVRKRQRGVMSYHDREFFSSST